MEIQGKLIKILAPVTGEGRNGAWTKQEFVIETFDQYPRKVCMSVWTDKVAQLQRFQLGDDLRVSFNLESREYNERWFTEVRAWRLDPASAPVAGATPGTYVPPTTPQSQGAQNQDIAGNFQPAVPQGGGEFFSSNEQDDLPF